MVSLGILGIGILIIFVALFIHEDIVQGNYNI